MAEISRFFDANIGSDGTPDLTYNAAQFAEYYAMFYSRGIINTDNYPESLKVTIVNNNTVNVAAGCAIIGGYQYINDSTAGINIQLSQTEGYIILRLDVASRKISAMATNLTTYPNTDVRLAYYKKTNGVLSIRTDSDDTRRYSKALYTHDFDDLKSTISTTAETVNNKIAAIDNQVQDKLNSIDDDLLNMVKNVDGAGSGLDADLLDGQQGSYYLNYANFTNAPKILYGTTEPAASAGNDGDIYILYEE